MYSGVKAKYYTRKNTKLILVTCIYWFYWEMFAHERPGSFNFAVKLQAKHIRGWRC